MCADITSHERSSGLPEQLSQLIDGSGVPLVVADVGGDDVPLVATNDAFCEMSGYDPDEVIGRNCRFLQPAEGAGPVRARIRAFLADGNSIQDQFVLPNVRKDGQRFINLLYMAKLTREDGPSLILGSQFDITTHSVDGLETYDRALWQDIRNINKLTKRQGWSTLSTYNTLATSLQRIARFKLNE